MASAISPTLRARCSTCSADCRRVLFVPFALHDRAGYTAKFRTRLEELGRGVDELAADATGRRQIETAEAVFVGGGNTFRLLKTLQEAELLAAARRSERSPGCPTSAPRPASTSQARRSAPPTTCRSSSRAVSMPSAWCRFRSIRTISTPIPGSTHMGETRAERIAEFHEENATAVVGLRERAWIRVEGARGWLGGERGACIFRRGSAPEERSTGDALDDLLV